MTNDKYKAQKAYAKRNPKKKVGVDVSAEFYSEFKNALDILGVPQAKVIKDAMIATIDKAKKQG